MDGSPVARHYHQDDLAEKLLSALGQAGADVEHLTREDLQPFEEFHLRGREATRELGRVLGLMPGMRVLDIGCGIGGPARTLAAEFGCRVFGVDLVPEFIRAARLLTERVGLSSHVELEEADALALPLPNGGFDAVVLEHVTMNVADKAALFREAARMLPAGGSLGAFEIAAGAGGAPHFPVPWASEPSSSHLEPPDAYRSHARAAGFEERHWHDGTVAALGWLREMLERVGGPPAARPPLGPELIMGPDAPLKIANLIRNLDENRVQVFRAVFTKA